MEWLYIKICIEDVLILRSVRELHLKLLPMIAFGCYFLESWGLQTGFEISYSSKRANPAWFKEALSICHVYNWNSVAKLSKKCVRKGSHVWEHAEKAGEIVKWKELANGWCCSVQYYSTKFGMLSLPVIFTVMEDLACGAWQQQRGVTQMITHCLEFLHLGDIMELLTN